MTIQEGRNPNETRPLSEYEEENPYLRKEGETHKEKVARLNRTKKLLKQQIDNEIGVKNKKLIDAFSKGKGGK